MFRRSRYRRQHWNPTIVDTRRGGLLDVVADRSADGRPDGQGCSLRWRQQMRWGVTDLSAPYRKTFTDALSHAGHAAGPFGVTRRANSTIDDVRRRVQYETIGGPGTKHDTQCR